MRPHLFIKFSVIVVLLAAGVFVGAPLLFAAPLGDCTDCACKEVVAWQVDGEDKADGMCTYDSGTGKYSSVTYAFEDIGAIGACKKQPGVKSDPKVTVYEWRYFDVIQTCKKNKEKWIEFSVKDSGVQQSTNDFDRIECTKN